MQINVLILSSCFVGYNIGAAKVNIFSETAKSTAEKRIGLRQNAKCHPHRTAAW
jgi:hypothetical protein